jgi:sugar phosphate isomerase/epimerase
MKVGVINNPRKDIFEEIKFISENGFDFIDLTLEPPFGDTYDPVKIKDKIEESNLGVIGHSNPTLPAIYGISSIRDICYIELKKSALFFKSIGVKKINIHPFYYSPHTCDDEIFKENIKVLQKMADYCSELGLDPMLENFQTPFQGASDFERVLNEVPKLFIHLDIGHLNIYGECIPDLIEFFGKFSEKIIHVHVHDNLGEEDIHLPIGTGDIDWPEVIKNVKNSGYDDTFTVEVFSPERDYLLLSKEKLKRLWASSKL